MPPIVALLLWLILLVLLLWFDPAKEPNTSAALLIPLILMLIVSSRLPSQWLGPGAGIAAQDMQEGNPLDRAIFFLLIVLAFAIVVLRGFNWAGFFSKNIWLLVFLSFALASVVWSDFPFISFKRWFRDLGNYLVILVVLSDPEPQKAVRTLLRRLCYLLIPLSILLNKYFPDMSRRYDSWTGTVSYAGVTTGKNLLGVLCLFSAIFFFWDTVTRWPDRKDRRTRRIIQLNVAFIAMTLWLLNLVNSATSRICLVIGCVVIAAVNSRWGKRHLTLVKVMIPATFCLYLILAFGLDLNGKMASAVGRDPTLTDRTLIWKTVLSEHTNPLIGAGYESFWLGPRLERIWSVVGQINEAHNGYIGVYLQLGLIGLFILVAFLLSSYRNICRTLTPKSHSALGLLSLAVWTILLFYNVTEAAFGGGLLWMILLLGGITVPERVGDRFRLAVSENPSATARSSELSLETSGSRRWSRTRPLTKARNKIPAFPRGSRQ